LKKSLPNILIGVVVAIAAILLLYAGSGRSRTLDENVTFRRRDKIPYGTYAAYQGLQHIFPNASVFVNDKEPGYWDSLSTYGKDQALVIICPEFNADASDMKTLVRFAEHGNDVFISTMELPSDITEILNCDVNTTEQLVSYFSDLESSDTLTVSLAHPPFARKTSYTYPGKQFDGYFSRIDTTTTTVLGYDKKGHPDFIHLKAGDGNVYVHLAPMAYTNYFLLHKGNLPYYENSFSMIPAKTTRIAWDEYFLHKKNEDQSHEQNWLSSLLGIKNPNGKRSFAAAFWVLLSLLLLYVLIEMRRKQRFIPVVKRPRNDSLDFVKTIGRLYHDKGDHRNLCKKMAAYFLEHVRNRYKLPTAELNDRFANLLQAKSGVPESEILGIVHFIRELDHGMGVSDTQLVAFHQQLESFYKKA